MECRLHDLEGEDFTISSTSPDDKSLNSDNVEDKDTSGTFTEEIHTIFRQAFVNRRNFVDKEVSELFC